MQCSALRFQVTDRVQGGPAEGVNWLGGGDGMGSVNWTLDW